MKKMNKDTRLIMQLIFIFLLVLSFLIFLIWPRTDETGTKKVLADEGYTDVHIIGHSWLGCRDAFSTEFEAVSPAKKPVKGVVCKGFFKAKTIRFY